MPRTLSPPTVLDLSGDGLTLADAERLLHGQVEAIAWTAGARKRVERARRCVMDLLDRGETIYGVNTGFGKLSNQRIEPHEVLALQENLLRSHAVGMGALLPIGVARLSLVLRIQALAKGFSGVTPELIDALVADALVRARHLARIADVAGAMTLEATRSSLRPFDPRIQAVRPHPGQIAVAANVRRLMEGSEILPAHADCGKVQDAYSIRCMPQVHGTLRDALDHITAVVERELNSATDNPLVFPDTGEVLSGGNFHAQPLGLAADLLAAAVADLSSICERRVENLVNPDLSGLPGFLTPHPGLNSGMMIVQVLAAALVSENKSLAFPISVDSIPTSANREDHVSMSPVAGRKARMVVTNAGRVLAAELLCAALGLEFRSGLRPGRGAEAAYQHIREHVRPLGRDRTLHRDLEAVERLIRSGSLLVAVEAEIGRAHV